MDKESYETYEYLPNNTGETEQDQFLVVQDDDTFLINRQVQYVAQDDGQSCTIYDITPQQFFVGVNTSPDLVTTDNFILPVSDGTTNLYENSYLLQAVPNTNSDHNEEFVAASADVDLTDNNVNNQNGNCTEITLGDDQYKILEQRGWVLLEMQDKVLLLDTLGLHDVTNNNELIEQLKGDIEDFTNKEVNTNEQMKYDIKLENIAIKTSLNELQTFETALASPEIGKYTSDQVKNESKDGCELESKKHIRDQSKEKDNINKSSVLQCKASPQRNKVENGKAIRIPCNFSLKDIPDRIVLGKSVNGNNLIAKVVRNCNKIEQNTQRKEVQSSGETQISYVSADQSLIAATIEGLIEKAYEGKVECTEEQLTSARDVIKQLIQHDTFQGINGHNLVITKVVKNYSDSESIVPSVVIGRLEPNRSGIWNFMHIPDLLHKMMTGSVARDSQTSSKKANFDEFRFIHVLITESHREGSVEPVSIIVNKRYVPINKIVRAMIRKRQISKLFACSTCADIFNNELDLANHQEETHYVDDRDTLMIDSDKCLNDVENLKIDSYYILKDDLGTKYGCLKCSLTFNKLSNCRRHMKTHNKKPPEDAEAVDEKQSEVSMEPIYKCKMCSCTYSHSASLSKHILATHINVYMPLKSNPIKL